MIFFAAFLEGNGDAPCVKEDIHRGSFFFSIYMSNMDFAKGCSNLSKYFIACSGKQCFWEMDTANPNGLPFDLKGLTERSCRGKEI
jgi:hypothetical protein